MTSSLADKRKNWDEHPVACFEQFVRSTDFVQHSHRLVHKRQMKPISAKSAQTYIWMFGKFAKWMSSINKQISSLHHEDLLLFLDMGEQLGETRVPDLHSRIMYRYLKLLERCYFYLEIVPNPAQHAIFKAVRGKKLAADLPMVVLDAEQSARFLAALPVHSIKYPTGKAEQGWKRRRDRVMQLVMLCAGLKVAEVIGLLTDEISPQVETDGTLELSLTPEAKHNTSYTHSTFLIATAVQELLAWQAERKRMLIPGALLFPGDTSGRRLNQTTLYRQTKATFMRAGLDLPRSGGRVLRNTYAAQQLGNGVARGELTQKLGLALERSVEVYSLAAGDTK